MSEQQSNYVRLHGTAKVRKAWPAKDGKQAMCFGGVRVPGDKGSVDVKCFGEAAEAFGNADGLTVTVEGKIGYEKPYPAPPPGQKVPWPMVIIVEKVTEHAPRGHEEPPPPSDEDFGF